MAQRFRSTDVRATSRQSTFDARESMRLAQRQRASWKNFFARGKIFAENMLH
jgi:hypothetical protein